MSRGRRFFWGLLMAILIAGSLWSARSCVLTSMGRWLDVGGSPVPADYVLVLNGDENVRPFVAAALVKAGLAHTALVTKTVLLPQTEDLRLPRASEVNRRVLIRRGVDPQNVEILLPEAATTYDEARALASFLAARPEARALIVTNDYHTRRSRWVFARALGERSDRIAMVSAPNDQFELDAWWRNEAGFMTVGSEYLKLAFYVVCYGNVIGWLAACALLAATSFAAKSIRQFNS